MARKKKKNNLSTPSTSEVLEVTDVYTIINYVQTQKKECIFSTSEQESYVIENILNDTKIQYTKSQDKDKVTYCVKPCDDNFDDDYKILFDDSIYIDEIREDGQCF